MNWINLIVFAILAGLGFYYAGTFLGQLMTLATCIWAYQLIINELDDRRKNLHDRKNKDDDFL